MTKESTLLLIFALTFVVLAMRSMVDKQARVVLYEFSKLFMAGYVGYLLNQ